MDSKPNNAFVAAPCLAISAALFSSGTWPCATLAACLKCPHSSALGRFAPLLLSRRFLSRRLPARLVP